MMNYSVFLSASWTLLSQIHRGRLYDHVGAPYAPVMRLLAEHILLVQVLRLDPAQTTESSGSSQGPDVEGSWQTSLSGVCD